MKPADLRLNTTLCLLSTARRVRTFAVAAAILTGIMGAPLSLKADDLAYLVTKNGTFGTIDLATGVFSTRGTTGQTLAGLGVANGGLYGISYDTGSSTFYQVNPSNGALTSIGSPLALTIYDLGSTTNGIYALVDDANLDLYSINPANGVATLVGPTNLTLGATTSFSTNGSTLYVTTGTNLYSLNTSTGASTLIGGLGGGRQEGALLRENGTLYGSETMPGYGIDTINPATGVATAGPNITGTSDFVYGLAPDPGAGAVHLGADGPWRGRVGLGLAPTPLARLLIHEKNDSPAARLRRHRPGRPQAHAAFTLTLTEVGNAVQVNGTGTLDLNDLPYVFAAQTVDAGLDPAQAIIYNGQTSAEVIGHEGVITRPESFGTSRGANATSGTGEEVGLFTGDGTFVSVPAAYVNGTLLTDSSTYDDASFSSLGITPGTYTYTWGSGVDADAFVITTVVPEPSTWALLGVGAAGLGLALRQRHLRAPRHGRRNGFSQGELQCGQHQHAISGGAQ